MKNLVSGLAIVAALVSAAPAAAQGCFVNGQPDQQSSQTLQRLMANSDPRVRQMLTGTWYGESQSPMGQAISSYYTYGPNGEFSYRQQVCGGPGMCSSFQGQGRYAGEVQPDGSIYVMRSFGDNAAAYRCAGGSFRLAAEGLLTDSGGGSYRRVQ